MPTLTTAAAIAAHQAQVRAQLRKGPRLGTGPLWTLFAAGAFSAARSMEKKRSQ